MSSSYKPRIGDLVRVHATQKPAIVTIIGNGPIDPYFQVIHDSGFIRWVSAKNATFLANAFDLLLTPRSTSEPSPPGTAPPSSA